MMDSMTRDQKMHLEPQVWRSRQKGTQRDCLKGLLTWPVFPHPLPYKTLVSHTHCDANKSVCSHETQQKEHKSSHHTKATPREPGILSRMVMWLNLDQN